MNTLKLPWPILFVLAATLLVLESSSSRCRAQGTAFTYQGRLDNAGVPANGSYDFQFVIYDSNVGGSQQGAIVTTNGVAVSNGLFQVSLDFGGIFTGGARWLDIAARTNGAATFSALSPRQNLTPVPYSVYAASAASAANFSGALAGDVTGTQGATVVGKVGGQTAANVATATTAANGATSANTANTLVKRDASGNFTAGTVTAAGFSGSGASLTSLNASQLASGTVPSAQLSGTYASALTLNNAANSFSGSSLSVVASRTGSWPNAAAKFENTSVTAANAPALRVVNDGGTNSDGALSVSANVLPGTGSGLIAEFGNANAYVAVITNDGTIYATGFNGNGAGLNGLSAANVASGTLADARLSGNVALLNTSQTFAGRESFNLGLGIGTTSTLEGALNINTNAYLFSHALNLRGETGSDHNHGLAYNGGTITNFGGGAYQVDGPALWGYAGGVLGTRSGGDHGALQWSPGGVAVNGNASVTGNLSANNTPGVSWTQAYGGSSAFPSANQIAYVNAGSTASFSQGNLKPAPGYFVLTACVTVSLVNANNTVAVSLVDVTSGNPVYLVTSAAWTFNDTQGHTVPLNWVVPITSGGGYQNFAIFVQPSGSDCRIYDYNLTVMYFPRANN